jgi:hypothetical protein
MRQWLIVFVIPVVIALPGGVAAAGPEPVVGDDTTERLVVHGFGNWVAGLAEKGRSYGIASDQLDARNVDVALSFSAFPVDGIAIHVQPFFDVVSGVTEASLDFGFVSWEPSDRFKLHAGKVQQPVGLFSQFFDVGTLRPFAMLPQGVYGATGVMSEGYYGMGASGTFTSDGDWSLAYDVYGGQLDVAFDQTVEEVAKAAGDESFTFYTASRGSWIIGSADHRHLASSASMAPSWAQDRAPRAPV